ncbi:XRE family transcriptional regulator [Catalinimonas niigatensis]|uniref:XRE family transcriptional regulator n=1 Tax=Catalinimonas niigatensis TaxID=1397264 RepID=UPI0026662EF7|nr:LexA family transcriptional regulator [Catalinimonas niigatensis]WPP51637.1 LexA family transcriptional regulator [Catalinimonas niigatensis]
MSTIGKNIKKIRVVKKISQAAFAEMFNLSRGTVGSYEEERAEPKLETIIQIAQKFGLSIDILLTKELTVNELFKFDLFKHEKGVQKSQAEQDQIDKDEQREATPLIRSAQYIEYIVNFQNKDFINRLPFVNLPNTNQKKSRAFEVQDDSMTWLDKGLQAGDILSCCPIIKPYQKHLETGKVYVIVGQHELYIRRFNHAREKLHFTADNPQWQVLDLEKSEILELWKVEGFYSTFLKPPLLIEERISVLEQKMMAVEKQLGKIKKN